MQLESFGISMNLFSGLLVVSVKCLELGLDSVNLLTDGIDGVLHLFSQDFHLSRLCDSLASIMQLLMQTVML